MTSSIWIESTRDPDDRGAACLIRWDAIERYASVADVRQTAEDLFTCAAFADLIAELLRAGIEAHLITAITTAMVKHRTPRYFGTPATLFMLPGGSSKRKEGVVMLAQKDLFHKGKTDNVLTPDEARTMGRRWLEVAEASEADTLFSAALRPWLNTTELDALFSLVRDIRTGEATLP